MYEWGEDAQEQRRFSLGNLIIFVSAALIAILLFLVFAPQIHQLTETVPYITELMYFPTIFVGFLFEIGRAHV